MYAILLHSRLQGYTVLDGLRQTDLLATSLPLKGTFVGHFIENKATAPTTLSFRLQDSLPLGEG